MPWQNRFATSLRLAPLFASLVLACQTSNQSAPLQTPVASTAPAASLPLQPTATEPSRSSQSREVEGVSADRIQVPDHIRAAVGHAARSEEDRALDAQRKPELMLAFFGIQPGMSVAELGAGRGYTAELLARVVGA